MLQAPFFHLSYLVSLGFYGLPGDTVVKNLPANARDIGGVDSITESGRSPGEGHGKPLQYPCLESSIDRGAHWAITLLQRVGHY